MSPLRKRRTAARVGVALIGALVLASGALAGTREVMLRDSVLPGVHVAGVDVGSLERAHARAKIRAELAGRLGERIRVRIGGASFTTRAADVFVLDADSTERAAYEAKRDGILDHVLAVANPFAVTHDVAPVLRVRAQGRKELRREVLRITDRPVNAQIRMKGVTPVVEPAKPGTTVVQEELEVALREAVVESRKTVRLDVAEEAPPIGDAEAAPAARKAETAVSAPVTLTLHGDPVGALGRAELATLLRFHERGSGYAVSLARTPLVERIAPMVAGATRKPEAATFAVDGTRVKVVPSKRGLRVDAGRTAPAVRLAAVRGGARTARVALERYAGEFTTRDAKKLGIREQLVTYTTDMGSSSANRIWNVQLLGRYLDGTIVEAGETFSYNEIMGPRTVERGFREGHMIFGGVLIPSIGGGVCQTATTIFNAAFEVGLPIRDRRNHSFYISHYPMGRDATVNWGTQDFVFKNDLDHAILIKAYGTTSTFTVSFYGTKQGRRVESSTSAPTNYTQPELQYAVDPSAPAGSVRTTGAGGPGFDVNVHRRVYERGKLIREDDFFSRYVPENPTQIHGPGSTPPGPYFTLPASA